MTTLSALALGVRLSGESVADPTLAQLYGDHSLSGELVAASDLPHGLRGTLLLGYRRMGGKLIGDDGLPSETGSWIRYVPMSALVGYHNQVGPVDLGIGIGPSAVSFAEQVGQGDPTHSRGLKWGGLVEGTARVEVGQMQATETALGIEASVGYRLSVMRHGDVCEGADVCGFNLSALRLGVGVVALF